MAPHRESDGTNVKGSAHRDADEEALQAALQESLEPDYMAEILQSEQRRQEVPRVEPVHVEVNTGIQKETKEDSGDDDDDEETAPFMRVPSAVKTEIEEQEDEEEEEDPNEDHVLLNFADILLINILKLLDEDTIGASVCTCKRLLQVARSEVLFEAICRRIFPVQCPRAAVAAARNRFELRRFPTWFDMFHDRPRVRYNGFYWLRISYYKKPELNMWTDIVPGTILKCIYYRYFSFQRDGSVLYGMLFKPPHEIESHLRDERKGVHRGRFYVEKDQLMVTVPTNCNEVNFRLTITQRERGKNVKLLLNEHYANSEPDGSGWINYYDTADEEFHYYRSWKLNFSSAYDSGSIPCRINHGSIRHTLQWTKDPNALSFDPLLITCVEGFLEMEHPFVFLARTMFRELLKLEDAREKTLPILVQIIMPLRNALMSKDDETFLMALEATRLLSDLMEGEMNIYLSKLTQQIHRKLLTKQLRSEVEDTLGVLESNGGKEALSIIRSKIPTYASIR
ncbi:hypothetical protein BBJ29_002483 [Phytophthora kernoviae]|uniref:F-box protein Hrt3/FBXO9 C-terminal domain-containing protein n=1 Tax=Phytophthora kernoviae TaxID=325452 RepID=A0A3F2RPT8_9STRA|nr:hypothetical protein BBJ29_002483 [Phytophthora kernoviae]RLN61516.1 hypothetical protein BBP00_00005342 [Phytophthora kernoviae]